MPQLYSNCCYAEMRLGYAKDICPACKEGCSVEEEEPDEEGVYEPRVGDRVSLEGEISDVYPHWFRVLFGGEYHASFPIELSTVKILSRKTRTLTKAEAEAMLSEKLGESVEIE